MGTPQSWSTVLDHSTNAGYNAWGLELQTMFVAAGATQSADTGQITWGARTRAAINTDDGYQIFYITGSLHATAPIYCKVYYGTGGVTNAPRLRVEIGPSTNGTGTVTGTAKTVVTTVGSTNAPTSNVVAYQSFLCCNNGSLWLGWKNGAGTAGPPLQAFFAIHRTADSTGAFDGASALFIGYAPTSLGVQPTQVLEFSPAQVARTLVTSVAQTMIPSVGTNSLTTAGDLQLYNWWATRGNQATPIPGVGAHFTSEAAVTTTFTSAPIGATSRTFISMERLNGVAATSATGNTLLSTAHIWEG